MVSSASLPVAGWLLLCFSSFFPRFFFIFLVTLWFPVCFRLLSSSFFPFLLQIVRCLMSGPIALGQSLFDNSHKKWSEWKTNRSAAIAGQFLQKKTFFFNLIFSLLDNLVLATPPPFMRLVKHLTALRAWFSNVCLVGENPTCSVPA